MPAPQTLRHARRRRALAALATLAVLGTGCSLTEKNAEGRRLHDAPKVLAESGSVELQLEVASRLVRKGTLVTVPGADPGLKLTGVLDLDADRASYARAGKTVVVFDDKHAFALRPKARPSDARPWVAVSVDEDLKDRVLDPAALHASLAALTLRPSVLVDALSGALTGSIKNLGADTVDGIATTKYFARVDLVQGLEKSTRREYSQREQDDLVQLFEVLGIEEDALHEGTIWLDAQGAPRRFSLALHETPAPKSLVLVVLDLRLTPRPDQAQVPVPDPSTVTTVPSLFQYLQPLSTGAAA